MHTQKFSTFVKDQGMYFSFLFACDWSVLLNVLLDGGMKWSIENVSNVYGLSKTSWSSYIAVLVVAIIFSELSKLWSLNVILNETNKIEFEWNNSQTK